MCGIAAITPRNTPRAFTSITRSQFATVASSRVPATRIPALLTSTSSLPNASIVASMAACHDSGRVTSRWTYSACPPISFISASTLRPSSSSTSPNATFAPSRANSRASAAPIPRAPPLTNATLPASLMCQPPSECSGVLFCGPL